MVEILNELKAKLAEIDAKTEGLRCEIVVLDDQKAAFETVIRVYEPGFELASPPSKTRRASSRETASGRVTELLKGKNNRHIVLDILRRLGKPTTTAEIAERFASEADLGSEAARVESALTSRNAERFGEAGTGSTGRHRGGWPSPPLGDQPLVWRFALEPNLVDDVLGSTLPIPAEVSRRRP
ncbi:hypothetical protein DXT98_29800 [Agrobacterium sp. ICMP 7243]|nr:hypothetical protein DXT98_29800 [Agrobacterium sp. ICMP 7243]NTG18818.1 hypothetical protein [Rhizobium rhizogenes]NTH36429.1 hypothetical protein [Rhizobium rhizogenes]NTI85452.1 hypothetical protein [Rhizobium rhizogenes]NTI98700.1 hypothetical protein [Rhizobium rhizogenes]